MQKTITCKIHDLTKVKERVLQSEYGEFQHICKEVQEWRDNDYPDTDRPYFMFKTPTRYSATVWGAIRSIKKPFRNLNEQPLYLRNDVFKITENQTKISKHWLKLPTKTKHGGIWLPIHVPHKYEALLQLKVCDSKIIKKKGDWYLLLSVKTEKQIKTSYSNILAIDLGEKVMATVCGSDSKPLFLGREVRGIRRHYAWLRKRLGNKKALKTIKKIGDTEKRKVNDCLHKISRQIVDKAKAEDSVIVLGDLKGIRESAKGKGKRFNRIVSNMPYYKLTQYITYKAEWDGIAVVKINERGTSHTCSQCGGQGKRPHQGLFKCSACGYQANADWNGAQNIQKRFLEQASKNGAPLAEPITMQAVATHA